ncbi:hypothetical protein [Aquabacterium sp.]|uniref:hypothetical protein n=1 Tax=Aquabacterium sp. TaxID=1872578 RepID=UPI002C61D102|nr:hypothetical protein [Aquabacterium sp.]HSW09272.1 hypothetical protein [Aquabacterium sp.]
MSATPLNQVDRAAPDTDDTPVDWMRIFAARLAPRRMDLTAEQVVQVAIEEFIASHALPPEQAAAQCAKRQTQEG